MIRLSALLLAASLAAPALAQTDDEQLLSAQHNFQRARDTLSVAQTRTKLYAEQQKTAEQRLLDAQAALERARADLVNAQTAERQAQSDLDEATLRLNTAWKRKTNG